jgi:hypothetical protein
MKDKLTKEEIEKLRAVKEALVKNGKHIKK